MKIYTKLLMTFVLLNFCFLSAFCQISNPNKEGFVPNKETALKIAEAIWLTFYGVKINNSRPFIAELKNGKVWIVRGTLHYQKGGVPYIEIQKSDCKILKMYHGK